MHRLFADKNQIPVITGSDVHHIKDVLRMKKGDQLELLDGTGKIHLVKIAEIEKDKILCEIISTRIEEPKSKVEISIAQCLPKGKKMELIIQKCTELGAQKIIPTLSERSIAKAEKTERWQKVAREAAEQSGRTTIPEITPLHKLEEILTTINNYDLGLIPWEAEEETTLKSVLTSCKPGRILIIIGPEGGFSREEIRLAKQAGFTSITLGKRILRTETAGMAILAMLMYELG